MQEMQEGQRNHAFKLRGLCSEFSSIFKKNPRNNDTNSKSACSSRAVGGHSQTQMTSRAVVATRKAKSSEICTRPSASFFLENRKIAIHSLLV
jgi:hypothetical protein